MFPLLRFAEEKNADNVLIRSREFARQDIDNWIEHKEHFETYAPRYEK